MKGIAPTEKEVHADRIRYLREMIRQLQLAPTGKLSREDVTEICNEIYGTTNLIQEQYGEEES